MIEWLVVGSLNTSVAGGVSKNFKFNILSKGLYARETRNYKCLHIILRYTNPDFKISLYICVHIKTTSWNFAFYILRILKLFPVKFANFLKIRLIFNIYCFLMFINNFSHISRVRISKNKKCFNVKSLTYYFHKKTKILAYFQICISALLTSRELGFSSNRSVTWLHSVMYFLIWRWNSLQFPHSQ